MKIDNGSPEWINLSLSKGLYFFLEDVKDGKKNGLLEQYLKNTTPTLEAEANLFHSDWGQVPAFRDTDEDRAIEAATAKLIEDDEKYRDSSLDTIPGFSDAEDEERKIELIRRIDEE
eukprot:CAMPEP_0174263264 /NCGR_PEP_ID=MMETSP0439-20130205/17892_1 /TAXON_ID=0 /ORGANISM="Stereomyxa ramosa, Strain Chinc5" /LENGTH=116 /DNA_ID=CAMNT_0015348517 /DNA_START=301 /DNA_END=648 /DNA_ORIENTATION=+